MRVLIVKTTSMGDVIHTLPALTDAAAAIPDIQFDWVVEEGFAEIPRWHPAVDKVIPVAVRRWRKSILNTVRSGEWHRFRKDLKARKYDAVIDAQGLLKSALITRMAKGPNFGLDKNSAREPVAAKLYDFPKTVNWEQHAVERVRQLFAKSLNYPLPEQPGQFLLDQSRFDDDLIKNKSYVVFIHGTTWPTKHWPETYWCQLAQKVQAAGMHIVIPWGSEKEKERANCIAKSSDHIEVLPRLGLGGIAGVIANAKAAVAVDTGLGHLTAALETPAVSLYGPTRPERVGAYGSAQIHLTVDQCPKSQLPKADPEIFTPMTPDYVWPYLEKLLQEEAS
ncbi:lipopolysaccharide heptosyltransferase I [Endozoicomonas sp. 4G]|uniref:lipopolysaccharide heptosyltransferase I n=1 Tax=Endozoicomonas sp. 4G TaxID=2872754 RepID=UPI002078B4AD|nr:lipopolysaccharide heptosyltransferase I [Endozoicomonas sp. 4G]